jgi:hypothetical protein
LTVPARQGDEGPASPASGGAARESPGASVVEPGPGLSLGASEEASVDVREDVPPQPRAARRPGRKAARTRDMGNCGSTGRAIRGDLRSAGAKSPETDRRVDDRRACRRVRVASVPASHDVVEVRGWHILARRPDRGEPRLPLVGALVSIRTWSQESTWRVSLRTKLRRSRPWPLV